MRTDNEVLDLVYKKAEHRRAAVRKRRQWGTAAVVVLVSAIALRLVVPNDGKTEVVANTPDGSNVVFEGIEFVMPEGWTVAKPGCGFPETRTVVIGIYGGSCPYSQPPPTPPMAVRIYAMYAQQMISGGSGTPIDWKGEQRGLIFEESSADIYTSTLFLPRLNAAVQAQASDAAAARALLNRVEPRPRTGLDVPAGASSIFIESFTGTDGDGQQRNASVTIPSDVAALLDDLRSLTILDAETPLCDEPWAPQSATITVHFNDGTQRTYAARFDSCAQVIGGTGAVARTSNELRADVKRLVPNSGLS